MRTAFSFASLDMPAVEWDYRGTPVRLVDTAGIRRPGKRDSANSIEWWVVPINNKILFCCNGVMGRESMFKYGSEGGIPPQLKVCCNHRFLVSLQIECKFALCMPLFSGCL